MGFAQRCLNVTRQLSRLGVTAEKPKVCDQKLTEHIESFNPCTLKFTESFTKRCVTPEELKTRDQNGRRPPMMRTRTTTMAITKSTWM
jgi:hypothetical protein